MSFEQLLSELETMSKALPDDAAGEDDKKIQAAATEGTGGDIGNEGDLDADVDDGHEEDGLDIETEGDDFEEAANSDSDGMTKSFRFTLENGEVVEAEDGTDLVKSLMERINNNEASLTKALETTVSLIKSQGNMIKSLEGKVAKLSGQGRGRKAVVSIVEKQSPALIKSQQEEGMTANEFMTKALAAQAAGHITGNDVARAEAYLNKGMQVPSDIVTKVAT